MRKPRGEAMREVSHLPEAVAKRREKFAEEVASGNSLTAAAIEAGYSPASAHHQGHRLAQIPAVAQAISDRRSQGMRAAGITVQHVYERLAVALDDDAAATRASLVRAGEILLKTSQELGPDAIVQVDARTPLLPTEWLELNPAETREFLAWCASHPDAGADLHSRVLLFRLWQLGKDSIATEVVDNG